MTEWRHVEEETITDLATFCAVEVRRDIDPATWWLEPCGCTTPTPDPTSPCGWQGVFGCGDNAEAHPRFRPGHPHQPTRCTCGHPVERVP